MTEALPVVFLHGLESGPHGTKYLALKEAFGDVTAPDFTGVHDLEQRLTTAREAELPERFILVGSSFGGVLASLLTQEWGDRVAGLLLLAPAFGRAAGKPLGVVPGNTAVIHAPEDDVVPFEGSVRYCEDTGAVLIEVPGEGHRLGGCLDLIIHQVSKLTKQAT